ncbi:MAG: DsrE family protein [Burkholderiaceae bacterium]|nr:DsrE family protein [Sulfuritalea sp.]MCF8175610.1 DsrE family protein [Burkholderiaceae bacterium]MCF8184675.1 DsrE family protein [Polynucleobacter sp.]
MIRRSFIQLLLASTILAIAAPAATAKAAKQAKPGVIIQVSDSDPKTWNQALNVIKNIQSEYGADKVNVELVVFGQGAGMLKFDSPLASRVDETLASGATVSMCQNTMKGQKLSEADMHPKIGYVKAGVIEIIEKDKKGWTVVRP